MEWKHHLDVIYAEGLVEQFVDRGLTFQFDRMFPIHSMTICAAVAWGDPTTRAWTRRLHTARTGNVPVITARSDAVAWLHGRPAIVPVKTRLSSKEKGRASRAKYLRGCRDPGSDPVRP